MRQLPVFAALLHAFNSVWHNRWVALRISWVWYVILALVLAAGGQLLGTRAGADPQSPAPDVVALEFGMIMIVLLVNSSIAVNWHRYILLDEVPGTFEVLRMDGKVWRYLGNTFLMILALVAASMLVAFPLIFIAVATNALELVPLAGLLAVLIVSGVGFLRLGIKLPAIALGGIDFRFVDAWRATSGNALQLAGLFLIVMLIVTLVAVTVSLFSLMEGVAALVVGFILQLTVNWFLTLFNISLLTSLYGFFVQNREF